MNTNINPLKPKKKRKYKGKEIERPETDRERKDRLLPGYDDMKRLSNGIPEDKTDACLIDDEINDDDEMEDDCLIPLNWADIASSNPNTQKRMRQTINEARDRAKKKKEKKNCSPGCPYHNEDGEFTSSGVKGSWSVSNPDGKQDCDYGKMSTTGVGKGKRWVRQPCGRKDVDTPNVKAKYRCKDGSAVNEADETRPIDIDPAYEDLADRFQRVIDRSPSFLKYLTYLLKPLVDIENVGLTEKKNTNRHKGLSREEIRSLCSRSGFFGWTDFLMKLSAIEQAKKGTISNQHQKS